MYTLKTTVSYSRLDRKGKVPYYEILNYLQDCSTFHSEGLGVGVDYLKSQNRAWVLLAYKIQIFKELQLGDRIEVGTCPTEFKKVFATRQFFIKDENGDFVVKAESIWSMLDIEERIPVRISEEYVKAYQTEQAFDSIGVSRKIKFAGEKKIVGKLHVPKTYIDTNGHVNNADYLRAAEEFLPEIFDFNQIEIVYNKEALEGESILAAIYNEEKEMGLTFENEKGELHAQIRFTKIQ